MSLEHFISQHRNAFVSMEACAEHIQYQLPNEHSRVGYLLEAIQCSDAGLQAAMASVKTDTGPNGMRNNFETAAAHLLPYDPVAKKRAAGSKRGASLISGVDGETQVSSAGAKVGIGKTGVHLRYHKWDEYKKLTKEQKDELAEYKKNNASAFKRPGKKGKKQQQKQARGSTPISRPRSLNWRRHWRRKLRSNKWMRLKDTSCLWLIRQCPRRVLQMHLLLSM